MVAFLLVFSVLCAPPAVSAKAPPPVRVAVVAVQAFNKEHPGKQYERGLEPVKAALDDLPYNTYRRLDAASVTAPFNEETIVSLSFLYGYLESGEYVLPGRIGIVELQDPASVEALTLDQHPCNSSGIEDSMMQCRDVIGFVSVNSYYYCPA